MRVTIQQSSIIPLKFLASKTVYEGMFVEMTGRASWEPPETGLELLTRAQLPPHLRHAPTRAEAGPGLWARVTAHPGLATRSRYGPGYLHHVQSWRHVPGRPTLDIFI